MDAKIKIRKKDNRLQSFDPKKIERVCKAAGVDADNAKRIAEKINTWIRNSPDKLDGISSLQIREIVASELKKISTYAYNLYTWYEKGKDGVK